MELHDKKYPIADKDLINKKFGKWTVLRKAGHNKRGESHWLCKCDCGTEKIVKEASLLRGASKSCGCLVKELNSFRYTKPSGVVSSNRVYDRYKKGAIKKGRAFELTKEEFIYLTSNNCYYCGSKPKNICNIGKIGDYTYNGIDRIDNTKGYIIDNCITCCETCNRAKLKMTKFDFLEWIDRVYIHQHELNNHAIKKGL